MKISIFLIILVCCFLPGCIAAATYGEENWTMVNSSAAFSPRYFHGAVTFNNHLWIIGGSSNGTMLCDVWSSYDGNNWTLVTDQAGFGPRHGISVTGFNGKLWVMGGGGDDVWSSDNGRNWTLVTSHAGFGPRSFPGTAVFENRLWIIGDSDTDDVWSSDDGVNWTRETEHTGFSPRHGMGIVVYDNKLWVIGGMFHITDSRGVSFGETRDVWSSRDGVNWVSVTSDAGFEPMEFCPAVVYDNKIWIAGGGSHPPTHSEKYAHPYMFNSVLNSLDGKNWTLLSNNPGFSPRFGQSVVEFNNTLWLIGGDDNSNPYGKNDVWSYRSDNQTQISNNPIQMPMTSAMEHETHVTIPDTINSVPVPTRSGMDTMASIILILTIFGISGYLWEKR